MLITRALSGSGAGVFGVMFGVFCAADSSPDWGSGLRAFHPDWKRELAKL